MMETTLTDAELLRLAYKKALDSPDPSTQNGAFLVAPDGRPLAATFACNEFPRGVEYTPERMERPLKYSVIAHAETNAIYAAAANRIRTSGTTMVAAWAACAECAKGIIQSGISTLITHVPADVDHEAWSASIELAMTMLDEAGIQVRANREPLGCTPVLRNGSLFTP